MAAGQVAPGLVLIRDGVLLMKGGDGAVMGRRGGGEFVCDGVLMGDIPSPVSIEAEIETACFIVSRGAVEGTIGVTLAHRLANGPPAAAVAATPATTAAASSEDGEGEEDEEGDGMGPLVVNNAFASESTPSSFSSAEGKDGSAGEGESSGRRKSSSSQKLKAAQERRLGGIARASVAQTKASPLRGAHIGFKDLQLEQTLGEGTFGRVKLARHRDTQAIYALKIIQKTLVVEYKQEVNVLLEKQSLTELDHPFVLKLWTTFKDRDCLFFLFDLVPGGELYLHQANSGGFFTESTAQFYSACVVSAFKVRIASEKRGKRIKWARAITSRSGFCHLAYYLFVFISHTTPLLRCNSSTNFLRCAHFLHLLLSPSHSPSSTISNPFSPIRLPSPPYSPPRQRYNVFNQKHVHDNGYIYRDLKPENLLIDKEGYITVVDFGFAKKLVDSAEDRTYTLCGTVEYFCPEMVAGKGYDRAADIWGVGILVYELIVG